jgi:hypothetical protein
LPNFRIRLTIEGMTRLIFIVVLCLLPCSRAMWMRVETTPIPVDRVLTNLTKRAATETNNFELFHAIARLHSLSYARASSNWVVNVATNASSATRFKIPAQTNQLPFFGHGPAFPPTNVAPASTSSTKTAANAHLLKAVQFYQRATTLNPTNEFVFLGLGWCQTQAGQTNEAKAALRRAVSLASQHEKMQNMYLPKTVTEETIDYLVSLLDPETDKNEIQQLSALAAKASRIPRYVTPLVIPLRSGLPVAALINTDASIAFDLDGSGIPNRKWQWITTNAAWIVHLPLGSRVTSALQMFGNVTFWMFWENGYHALASLDDNADGLLKGDELRGIRLWHDQNSDGICGPNEILELSALGITALDTRYTIDNQLATSHTGAHFVDNSTRPTFDIILQQRESK